MSNAIARLRMMGIAAQPTFGTAAVSATYIFPLTNAPVFNPKINQVSNEAALGSAYRVNDILGTTRFTDVPLEFKIDEDQVPLLLKQRFTIATTTTTEATAKSHALTYSNNTNTWYTLFLQDDNLQDFVVKNALFDSLNLTFDKDFVRASASVIGAYPTATAVTMSAVQPKEFVGRMVSYLDDDVPGTATATTVLSLSLNLDFGLNSEDTRFGLGSTDLAVLALTSDKFQTEVTRLKPDLNYYNDYEGKTMKQSQIVVQSLDRYVGSTTSTRPSITVTMPRLKIEDYAEEPDLEELTKEKFTMTMLKPAGVSGTPMSLTVVNQVTSY